MTFAALWRWDAHGFPGIALVHALSRSL
jgi:hypothetical protein